MAKIKVTASFGYKQPFKTVEVEIEDEMINHPHLFEILSDRLNAEISDYEIILIDKSNED